MDEAVKNGEKAMPKKFLVNGHEFISADETPYEDMSEMFKENITVDDMQDWGSEAEVERYTAKKFIGKARYYLSLTPSNTIQSAGKTWLATGEVRRNCIRTCMAPPISNVWITPN